MKVKYIAYLILAIVLGGLIYNKLKTKTNSPVVATHKSRNLKVEGIVARGKTLKDKLNLIGTIEANESIIIRPEISGLVTEIYFKEGTFIKKGSLLLKIRNDDLQAQLQKAEAQKKLALETEQRSKALLGKEAISKQEYDQALTELHALGSDADLIKAQINKSFIKAPFDGVIGLKNISVGDYVNTSTSIASLTDANHVKISFSVPERYAGHIKKNREINFRIEGTEKLYKARIYAIEPRVDPNTRTVTVRAIAPNYHKNLLPGAFSKIEFPLKEIKNAIMIPTQAIVPILNGKQVYVKKNGVVTEQIVETGARTKEEVQITAGIRTGDTIITTGIMSMKKGVPVSVTVTN